MNIQFDHKPLFLQVKEFYTAFRQPYFQGMDYQRILLRDRLFSEEHTEGMIALNSIMAQAKNVEKKDVISLLDAVVDALYITYGTILEHHGDISEEINLLLNTNWNPEGKERFFNKHPEEPAFYIGYPPNPLKENFQLTANRLSYFCMAATKGDEGFYPLIETAIKPMVNDNIFDTFVNNEYGYYFTYEEIYHAFNVVHKANMSKLDKNGNPMLRADGKILKPEGWQPPNLEPVLTWI